MKPSNPMRQLEQWKASHQQAKMNRFVNEMNTLSKNGAVNQSKTGSVKNSDALKFEEGQKTQQEAQGATKDKRQGKLPFNPLVVEYSQITRQFKLIHDSNRKCLEVYPDDFHHKLKMREECADLVNRLNGGGKLFNELAKGTNLTQEQTALLKAFNQVSGYLIHKFSEVAEQIDQLNIERVEGQKTTGSKAD
ncbi:hypothetical protein [Aggregatibacter actinomycetemcomitans]|uniref:hypothetical protein n=1 Tax=Aggregatibacter actinomycetemcomitans TaxID=714 RepID=UPI0002F93462|nr:hypothetical protein [Aggregatibacter actinomycetemcomitans]KOE65874.1 hypothetical protein A160_0204345 [Aggregatibacter actinomycetemcomitans serotype e str. A160]KOE66621.1 hypothetical protein SCC393_0304705 [Aggregatibacter actinomycetemcomitans serotype e str. SCC393]KYK76582.1 hypothetical protein SA2876_06755 [Aggregatibacter actinomycetemcomitans serotype e str. SA2876]TYA48639.1 hypothetical protein FXB74_08715 [Aggregatibacter actinomycetemcomitans]